MESTYDIVVHYSSRYWPLIYCGVVAGVLAAVALLADRPRGVRNAQGLKALVLQIRHNWEAALLSLAFLAVGIATPASVPQAADSVTAALESAGYSQVEIGNLKHVSMLDPTLITATKDGVKQTCSGRLEWDGNGGWVWSPRERPATLVLSC